MSMHLAPPTPTETQPPPKRPGRVVRWVRGIPIWFLLAVGALAVVAVVFASMALTNRSTDAQASEAAVRSAAAPLASAVQGACASGGAAAAQLNSRGACAQASAVQSVIVEPVPGPSGAQGPGPSNAQVQAYVDGYFATHPLPAGQLPPVSEVASLVAGYLQRNPPANGQDATPDMVAEQVNDFCATHNGCGAGSAEIAAQVQAYCSGPTAPCVGPAGKDGTDGTNGADGHDGTDGTNGTNGVDGKPPATYTVQVPGLTGSTTETCTRTGTPDDTDANPVYACS